MGEIEIAPRVVINDAIHPGRPIIKGTRIPVSLILGSLAAGMTIPEIQREYGLAEEDIRAALEYACAVIEHETIYPLPVSSAP